MPQLLLARQSAQTLEDREFSVERLVNLYVRAWPTAGVSPGLIKQTDGLVQFVSLATNSPVRAMIRLDDLIYAVSAGNLYSVSSAGTVTELSTALQDDANTTMFVNDNSEVGIAAGGTYYVWDIVGASLSTPTMNALTGPQQVTYLDGYGVLADNASDRFQITGLSDAASLGALDFDSADDLPDGIVGIIAYKGYLWIFGQDSTGIYRNTGATDFPFQQLSGGIIQRGCFGAPTIAADDQSVFLVGDDRIVYRIVDTTPVRISTNAVERSLRNYTTGDQINGFTWAEDGHKFYALRLPDAPALVYDISMQTWHERASGVFGTEPWTAVSSARAFGYELIGSQDGIIYRLDPTAFLEGSTSIARIVSPPPIVEGTKRSKLPYVAIDARSGAVDIGREAQIALRVSQNGIHWSPEKWRSMGPTDPGDQYLATWRGLGQRRKHYLEFKVTDPVPVSIYGSDYRVGM